MKRRSYQAYLRKQDAAKSGISDTRIPSVIDGDSGIASLTPENQQSSPRSNEPATSNTITDTDYVWQVFNWCIGFSALASLEILASKYMEGDWGLLLAVVVITCTMFVSSTILMLSMLLPFFKRSWTFLIISTSLWASYGYVILSIGLPMLKVLINHSPI